MLQEKVETGKAATETPVAADVGSNGFDQRYGDRVHESFWNI